ncbi:MAG: hypothetical protein II196_08295, partial [Spirochaetales bacterium]|nr:hypothetical protein [Spirochaetales bacterium]
MPFVNEAKVVYETIKTLSNDDLRGKTIEFKTEICNAIEKEETELQELRARIENEYDMPVEEKENIYKRIEVLEKTSYEKTQTVLNKILPEAFAVVKETARRFAENEEVEVTATDRDRDLSAVRESVTIRGDKAYYKNVWSAGGNTIKWDMVHYDVQLIGGIVLHNGKIAEMATGEGKTLVATLPVYLNALPGKGVHVVTVNDYLAKRDSEWMAPVYKFLGLSVGCILTTMTNQERRENYAKDITYGTNNEFGFDYLRDNMIYDSSMKVQRGFAYCIVDEIDSVLIDEARTPLIISGPAENDTKKILAAKKIVPFFKECEKNPDGRYPDEADPFNPQKPVGDYKIEEKSKNVTFTDDGMNKAEQLLQERNVIHGSLYDQENFEYVHYVLQALRASLMYQRDVDYMVKDNEVQIIDEHTGRALPGRRYSDGLHQAIEAKENITIQRRSVTYASITFQNFFRMYSKLGGMTGTADTEAGEFKSIYNLDVVVIPTNVPVQRQDLADRVYMSEREKLKAVVEDIIDTHKTGQPILVGTISVEKSEQLSAMLTRHHIRHNVLNAKNHAREADIIAEAGRVGAVTIATNMAGRGTDIKLGGDKRADYLYEELINDEDTPEEIHPLLQEFKEKIDKMKLEEAKALVWQVIFHYHGTLNQVTELFGMEPVDWLKTNWSYMVLTVMFLW